MKVSKYEVILPLINSDGAQTGEYALVNGLYGAVDITSQEEAQIISAALNDPSKIHALSTSRIKLLTERGHISENYVQEDEDLRIISNINTILQTRSSVNVVLLPTYDCNFRCTYCCERHRLERGIEWLGRTMSKELVDSIFAQLKDYRERGFKVSECTLFGGEPLLARNKELIRYICEKCREMELSISAITNGYELDRFIDIIDEYKIKFLQITVDGIEEFHNRMRMLAGGGGSYAKIMENIALALEHDTHVSMRINVTKTNLSGLRAIIDEVKSRGFTGHKNFSYYFKAAMDYFHMDTNYVSDIDIVKELMRTGSSYEEAVRMNSSYKTAASNFAGWLDKTSWPYAKTKYCGAEGGMNVIGSDGLIYPCWNVIAMDDKAIGIVDDGKFLYDFSMAKWRTRTVDRMTPCKTCPILMLCGGGCAAENFNNLDNLSEGACANIREIWSELAPRMLWKVRHEGFDSLKEFNDDNDDDVKEPDKPKTENISESLTVHSKYADNPECMSLSLREFLSGFTPDERKILMTTNDEREAFDILKAHNNKTNKTD